MTARIEWFGIAEDVARDSRGAFTLVGVNANLIQTEKLPVQQPRVFSVLIQDEGEPRDLTPESGATLRLTLESPTGETVFVQSHPLEIAVDQPRLVEDTGFQFLVGLQLDLSEYGTYTARVEIRSKSGFSLDAHKRIYVVDPSKRLER